MKTINLNKGFENLTEVEKCFEQKPINPDELST